MDRVNNRFKYCKVLWRQADTSANYNAGIISRGQVKLHRLPGRSIRTDVADIALPSPVCHLTYAIVALLIPERETSQTRFHLHVRVS